MLYVFKVYLVTNLASGKKYVGQTYLTLDERLGVHFGAAFSGSEIHFHRSLRKRGRGAFKIELLADNVFAYEIDELETKFIAEHRSHDPKYGYNGTFGGQGCRATRETLMLISAGKQHATIERARELHAVVVDLWNNHKSRKQIDAVITTLEPSALVHCKTVIGQHRNHSCLVCFTDIGAPIDGHRLITRKKFRKHTEFGNDYIVVRNILRSKRFKDMSITDVQVFDTKVMKLYTDGQAEGQIAAQLRTSRAQVLRIIERHNSNSCPICVE